jgi:hypothetical protein
MKPITLILSATLVVGAASCAAPPRELSGPEVMGNLTSDPLDCMVYRGSDSTYYYFDRAQFKTTTRFKVRRNEVELPPNARVGEIPIGMKLRSP